MALAPARIDANGIGDHGDQREWPSEVIWITLLREQGEDRKRRRHHRGLMFVKASLKPPPKCLQRNQVGPAFTIGLAINKVPETRELIDGNAIALAQETVAPRVGFLEKIHDGYLCFRSKGTSESGLEIVGRCIVTVPKAACQDKDRWGTWLHREDLG